MVLPGTGRPAWSIRRSSPGLLAPALLVLLSLPLVWPFLTTGLTATEDTAFHLHRLYELAEGVAQGSAYPRWAGYFAAGYGFPFFSFYAPLSYYLAIAVHALGPDLAESYRLLFLPIPALIALAMYAFAREFQGRAGALVAAVAYVYLPFQIVDLYGKGALSESLAFVWLPLTMRAMLRLWRRGSRFDFLAASTLVGLSLLTHNVMSLLTLGALAGYGLVAAATPGLERIALRTPGFRPPGRDVAGAEASTSWAASSLLVLAAVSLGLGLAAFFWVPAFGERSYLGFEQLATGFFQPSSHLGIIWPPIQGSLLFDFRYPWRLGLVTAVLAAAGLAVALRRDGDRQVGIFGGLVVLGSLFLLSPLAAPVWQRAPLLNSFQFPWRILPLTGLATSLLIGFLPGRRTQHDALVGPEAAAGTPRARPAVETLHATSLPGSRNRWGGLLVAAILATILILTVLNRYPVRPLDAVDFGAGGIDHMASLAGWRLPPRESGRAVVGGPADNVRILRWETQRIDLEVVSQSPAAVTLHLLWFPGWGATVNARPAPILPTGLNALVGVEVPAGASRVSLAFGDTPLRRATTWVSALSLAVLLAVALTPSLSQRERVERHSLLLGVGVLLVAALLLAPWGRVALGGYRAARLAVEPNRDLGPLRLLRAELSSSPARAGYQELTLYWQSRAAAPALAVLTYAFEAGGTVIASSVEGPVGGSYPTDQWQVGEVVRDRIDLRLDAAPAALKIGLAAEGGSSLGSYWWQIGEPAGPVGIVRPLEVDFAGAVGLVGYALDRRSLRPGEPLTVEMLWQREPGLEAGQELGAFVHLIDPGGKLVAQNDAPLGGGKYPPAHWDEGETGRERRNLVVPAGALPGLYRLQAGLYTYPDLQRVPAAAGQSVLDLGPVAVTSPEVQPGSQATPRQSLAVAFPAASLDLIGYDSNPEAQRLAVSLYWRAAASPSEDLAVFVHLLDAAGRLAAQHDGDPAGGSYPTSLWAPGDLVRDTHYLATSHLPPGEYRLLAGLYRRADLQRLAGSPGRSDGAVDLGPVSIP